jgi:DNA-binding transcriptional LysR family regulator
MNLNQVQIFCAVAKHLSFSMAAEELFITQPAVSQQVKALERQLNVKLFERVGHKLFLTEAGEAALTHFQAMLTSRAEMEQTLAMLRGSGRGRLAVGANTTGGMYVAPGILRAFRDVSPEVEATLQIETTNRILDRVMQNMIDVAIVTGPVEDLRFTIRDLCPDEVPLIVSPSHPFAVRAWGWPWSPTTRSPASCRSGCSAGFRSTGWSSSGRSTSCTARGSICRHSCGASSPSPSSMKPRPRGHSSGYASE